MNMIIFYMVRALLCTILIESLLAFILNLRGRDITNVILVNVLTNPLVNSINMYITYIYNYNYRIISLTILEILAFYIEALIYKKYLSNKINPYILSLILNIGSFTLGILINKYL